MKARIVTRHSRRLPFQVWCKCGHISGQHAAEYPHCCACDGNRWIDERGSVCNCQAFTAAPNQIDPFARDRKLFRRRPLAKLKAAAVRIGLDGTRAGFKLAERLFREFPELRNA
jgi:hypothetical protein